jgi:hypothetical protein
VPRFLLTHDSGETPDQPAGCWAMTTNTPRKRGRGFEHSTKAPAGASAGILELGPTRGQFRPPDESDPAHHFRPRRGARQPGQVLLPARPRTLLKPPIDGDLL